MLFMSLPFFYRFSTKVRPIVLYIFGKLCSRGIFINYFKKYSGGSYRLWFFRTVVSQKHILYLRVCPNQDFPYGRSASLPFSSSRCRQSSSDRAYNLQRFWMLGARRSSIKSHFVHLNMTTPSVWAAFCNKLSSSHGTLDFITVA